MDDDASFSDPNIFVGRALKRKPDLVVHGPDRPETVRALLKVLTRAGNLYDRGGVLVILVRPSDGGPPIARELKANNVIVEAHHHCQPIRYDEEGARKEITLPTPVAQMLLDLHEWDLQPLAGVTTAPLLHPDGSILINAGYTRSHAMWCEPVPDLMVPASPTRADAEIALLRIRKAFQTFPFAGSPLVPSGSIMVVDTTKPPSAAESACIAALLTACCRPSLWLAPGALVVAPEVSGAGSGKGLLVRAICLIAYGHPPSAFTPGHDRQELDKRLVAALVEAGSSVFLDNVNSTALRSDTLASVLTERPSGVRILGRTQMVPLNCAVFIAITGNGLSVSEDLARRVIEIALDPQCEDPEARPFPPGFLNEVLTQRAELLAAALTIWRWGRHNEPSLVRGLPFGSYETWAEWVRDPLLTLGCRDPVEQVRTAKANDPRRQRIEAMLATWWEHHMDQPITAAQLATPILELIDPQGRGRQYVAARLISMAGTRAGGFVLTRQEPAGKWGAATYALLQTNAGSADGMGHRDHRGHQTEPPPDQRPDPPMPPMEPDDFSPRPPNSDEGWEEELTRANDRSVHRDHRDHREGEESERPSLSPMAPTMPDDLGVEPRDARDDWDEEL